MLVISCVVIFVFHNTWCIYCSQYGSRASTCVSTCCSWFGDGGCRDNGECNGRRCSSPLICNSTSSSDPCCSWDDTLNSCYDSCCDFSGVKNDTCGTSICSGSNCESCSSYSTCNLFDSQCDWDYSVGCFNSSTTCFGSTCSSCRTVSACNLKTDCAWPIHTELCVNNTISGTCDGYTSNPCTSCTSEDSCVGHNPYCFWTGEKCYDRNDRCNGTSCNDCLAVNTCRSSTSCRWDNYYGYCYTDNYNLCDGYSCSNCYRYRDCHDRRDCIWSGLGYCLNGSSEVTSNCNGSVCSTCHRSEDCLGLDSACVWSSSGFGSCSNNSVSACTSSNCAADACQLSSDTCTTAGCSWSTNTCSASSGDPTPFTGYDCSSLLNADICQHELSCRWSGSACIDDSCFRAGDATSVGECSGTCMSSATFAYNGNSWKMCYDADYHPCVGCCSYKWWTQAAGYDRCQSGDCSVYAGVCLEGALSNTVEENADPGNSGAGRALVMSWFVLLVLFAFWFF